MEKQKVLALPGDVHELSTHRSKSIVNYIITLLAFAKKQGLTHQDIVSWIHEQYEERGYYDEWRHINSQQPVGSFVELFIKGRRLLYDKIELFETEDKYVVNTHTWYEKEPSEAFFYFEIDPEEFSAYASILAIENAKRLGIKIDIVKETDVETAYIYKHQ